MMSRIVPQRQLREKLLEAVRRREIDVVLALVQSISIHAVVLFAVFQIKRRALHSKLRAQFGL